MPELRDSIAIQKGTVLTLDFLEKNQKILEQYNNYFLLYPDLFLDLIKTKDKPFNFFFYQRIFLRTATRYRYNYATFTRGTSKSFLAILSQILICMFLPNSNRFLVSQIKKASLDITRQKLAEIWSFWPLLHNEILIEHNNSDEITLVFKNGSRFRIIPLSATSRGGRETGGVMEECALIDGYTLSSVILPMMNVTRRMSNGLIDPDEPTSSQIYITSAGSKNTYAYERLIELLVLECINPNEVFIWGGSYELPVYCGLLDKKFLTDQKLSSTFSPEAFARESQSIWTGNSEESWFNIERLIQARTLLHCERAARPSRNPRAFYEIAVDVARYGGNDTSIMVIKVEPNGDQWKKKVVYTENITKASMSIQARRIKELDKLYNPREIVVDGNGVGAGLIDELVLQSYDSKGNAAEPLYVMNDQENYPIPRGVTAKVYNLKANAVLNSEIYSNFYVQLSGGQVALLANERVVKDKLLATKSGQRMSAYAKEVYLLPYIMTSRLIDEINNLRLKPTGSSTNIQVEQISKRINKDRVSALAYGLYRIKFYEDKEVRQKKSISGNKGFAFYSSKSKTKKG